MIKIVPKTSINKKELNLYHNVLLAMKIDENKNISTIKIKYIKSSINRLKKDDKRCYEMTVDSLYVNVIRIS